MQSGTKSEKPARDFCTFDAPYTSPGSALLGLFFCQSVFPARFPAGVERSETEAGNLVAHLTGFSSDAFFFAAVSLSSYLLFSAFSIPSQPPIATCRLIDCLNL